MFLLALIMPEIISSLSYFLEWESGLSLNNKYLKTQFLVMFIGVNVTFFPHHFLGLSGMPRRYSDYPDAYTMWNVISSIGSLISLMGVFYFIFILWEAFAVKRFNLSSSSMTSFIEWLQFFPPAEHSYLELPAVVSN